MCRAYVFDFERLASLFIGLLFVEDPSFGPALRNEAEAVYAARQGQPDFVDYEFVDYPGQLGSFDILGV